MFFTTAAVALAAASFAMAQDATTDPASLTQCAQSTLNFPGSAAPYYVAVVPSNEPCGSDAFAEYYDVTGQSVDYHVNIPSGTLVQLYVVDANGQEYWGSTMTVGDGDAACLGGDAAVTESSSSSSSDSSTLSTSTAPTTYVPPNAVAAATTAASGTYPPSSNSGNVANDSDDTTPANAADDTTTNGASTVTASATLLVGAFAAALALF
jgi:hypothetical protein